MLVIGGSPTTPGAVVLAGLAALRMGAGRLQIAVDSTAATAVAVSVPEAKVIPITSDVGAAALSVEIATADCVLVGPGMCDEPPTVDWVRSTFEHAKQDAVIVVDAAAISALPAIEPTIRNRRGSKLALTPNHQELDDLIRNSPDVETDGEADTSGLVVARHFDAVVTCFGTVSTPDGRRWTTDVGHPSLGTSGSGDVLAGFLAGVAARTGDPAQAACWATFGHAAAGQRLGQRHGQLGLLARELLDEVSVVLQPCGR